MTPEQLALREAVARAIYEGTGGTKWDILDEEGTKEDYRIEADAAIVVVLETAARVAEGPPYKTSGTTGEVSIRGTDKGNWSVPMPLSGFKGSDYGTGRYDAATAIRALMTPCPSA